MKRLGLMVTAALLAAACGGSEPAPETAKQAEPVPAPAAPTALPADWTATDGIAAPESVYYDAASGAIFSSQIVGAPDGRDGNGRIVKMDANGQVVNANFVTGLNAPKGLRMANGTLWTADLDEAVGIDPVSGKITARVKLAGAMFANDVAAGADGTVYISDMMGNKIFAVKDGKASVFVEGDMLEHPNGILVDGNRLIVGGWGSAPKPDFSTDVPGHLFAIDLATKAKTLITPEPLANIDGLEADGRGGFVVTDYLKGQVIRVSASGQSSVVAAFGPGTADIGFMAEHNMVLIPHMNDNKVAAYTLP